MLRACVEIVLWSVAQELCNSRLTVCAYFFLTAERHAALYIYAEVAQHKSHVSF